MIRLFSRVNVQQQNLHVALINVSQRNYSKRWNKLKKPRQREELERYKDPNAKPPQRVSSDPRSFWTDETLDYVLSDKKSEKYEHTRELMDAIEERTKQQFDIQLMPQREVLHRYRLYQEQLRNQLMQEADENEDRDDLKTQEPLEDPLTLFKTQFGWDDDIAAKAYEQLDAMRAKNVKYVTPVNFKFNKTGFSDYVVPEDEEWKRFKMLEDKSVYYYGYSPKTRKIAFEGEEEVDEGEKRESPSPYETMDEGGSDLFNVPGSNIYERYIDMDKKGFYQRALALRPGVYIDKPNKKYKYLYTSDGYRTITKKDVAKIFIISNKDYEKHFAGGLGGELDDVFDRIMQRALMVREPVLPVIDHMKKVKEYTKTKVKTKDTKKLGYVFVGGEGAGKSSCLATVVAWATKNDFLVFYIPSARYWTHGVHYVEPSPILKGYFDAPIPQDKFIAAFQKCNEKILKTMKLSKNYDLPLEAGQKQPETLYDLCEWNKAFFFNNPITMKLLMDELLANKDVPMLFAIDEYNYFQENTGFSFGNLDEGLDINPKKVHAKDLVLVRGLDRILKQNAHNKIFVCANTVKTEEGLVKRSYEQSFLEPVYVKRYNFDEMKNICEYYCSAHYVYGTPEKYLEDLVYLTGAVPGRVWKEMTMY